VTNYDIWHPDHDSVTVEMVIANLQHNAINAQKVIQAAASGDNPPRSDAHSALEVSRLQPSWTKFLQLKEKLNCCYEVFGLKI